MADLAGWSYVAGGNTADRRNAELTRYFGFGLAGDILFKGSFYFFKVRIVFCRDRLGLC